VLAISISPESPDPNTIGFKQLASVLPVSHNSRNVIVIEYSVAAAVLLTAFTDVLNNSINRNDKNIFFIIIGWL
jgi:hypothetical protein